MQTRRQNLSARNHRLRGWRGLPRSSDDQHPHQRGEAAKDIAERGNHQTPAFREILGSSDCRFWNRASGVTRATKSLFRGCRLPKWNSAAQSLLRCGREAVLTAPESTESLMVGMPPHAGALAVFARSCFCPKFPVEFRSGICTEDSGLHCQSRERGPRFSPQPSTTPNLGTFADRADAQRTESWFPKN